jgi:hypothetical protein
VRAVAETSYRADVAFCVMTLLAALVIACDTGVGTSGKSPTSSLDPSAETSVVEVSTQVADHRDAPAPRANHPDSAVTRR